MTDVSIDTPLHLSEMDGIAIEKAIDVSREIFGDAAISAVARCALLARQEGRTADFKFWLAVFYRLQPQVG
jgi:hypothetical protein